MQISTLIPLLLSFGGGYAVRRFHCRWQSWAVAAGIGLGSFLYLGQINWESSSALMAVLVSLTLGALSPEMFRGAADGLQGFLTRNFGWILGGVCLTGACLVLPEEQLKGVLTLALAGAVGWHVFHLTSKKKKKKKE